VLRISVKTISFFTRHRRISAASICDSSSRAHTAFRDNMTALFAAMDSLANQTVTENGAPCYATTGSARCDAFAKLLRGTKNIPELFENALREAADDPAALVDLVLLWASTRAVRHGKGERKVAHEWFLQLAAHFPRLCRALICLMPDYGSWRDLIDLHKMPNTPLHIKQALVVHTVEQLRKEAQMLDDGSQLSLLGKWAPRVKSGNSKLAKEIAKSLFEDAPDCYARYRKLVSALNHRLDTVEVKMCGGNWADIAPVKVPARCLTVHRHAFLNQTSKGAPRSAKDDRVQCAANFVEALKSGKAMHGRSQHPHNFVDVYMKTNKLDLVIEAQWKDTITRLRAEYPTLGQMLCLSDVSGSMSGEPMLVSITFGLLCAALGTINGKPLDRFMTFSETPEWVQVPSEMSLYSKVQKAKKAPWGMSTNLVSAFKLILDVCVQAKVPASDVAELKLLIVSDMQFDKASPGQLWETTLQTIERMFRQAGYPDIPLLIFWNVRAALGFVAPADHRGVVQLAGFSPNLLKSVIDGSFEMAAPTSYEVMRATLDDPSYNAIRELCASVKEGAMANYACGSNATSSSACSSTSARACARKL